MPENGDGTAEGDEEIIGFARGDQSLQAQWRDERRRGFAAARCTDGPRQRVLPVVVANVGQNGGNERRAREIGARVMPLEAELVEKLCRCGFRRRLHDRGRALKLGERRAVTAEFSAVTRLQGLPPFVNCIDFFRVMVRRHAAFLPFFAFVSTAGRLSAANTGAPTGP